MRFLPWRRPAPEPEEDDEPEPPPTLQLGPPSPYNIPLQVLYLVLRSQRETWHAMIDLSRITTRAMRIMTLLVMLLAVINVTIADGPYALRQIGRALAWLGSWLAGAP